jgi:hypothetical protein
MVDVCIAGGTVEAGISYEHDGVDVCLIWNAFDLHATAIDVVIYFHGFAMAGGPDAPLSDFIDISGLACDDRGLARVRQSPTLAIIPRGEPAGSVADPGKPWPYYFSALVRDKGLTNLIEWALRLLAEARGGADAAAPRNFNMGRLILAAHSGGGRAVLDVLPKLRTAPAEILLCDALYHDPEPCLTDWLAQTLERHDAEQRQFWAGYGPTTAYFSRLLRQDLAGLFKAVPPARSALLETRYRVEWVDDAHMDIPRHYLPVLLSDSHILPRRAPAATNAYPDASQGLGPAAPCLADRGVRGVGRYYNYGSGTKVLTRREAQALLNNGIAIWVVFQFWNDEPRWFGADNGRKDAVRALQCAQELVGQPEGTAIYFGIDYNEKGDHYDSNIVPYFKAVRDTFAVDGRMPYRVGVYGNGLVCRRLLDDKLVTDTWLSCSSSYSEYQAFYASGRWSLSQTCGVPKVCGIDVDSNETNRDGRDFGQFDRLVPLKPSHRAYDAAAMLVELLHRANAANAADDDPAWPQPYDALPEYDVAVARRLANYGSGTGVRMESHVAYQGVEGPATVQLDITAALEFLKACMEANPRVGYQLGAKVPFAGAVPGKDFKYVDCSGFVREVIRRAQTISLGFPDGSVVQHDWVRAHRFAATDVEAGKNEDGLVRIAFLRPQDSPSKIGHVALIYNARTLESHGGVGPNARNWTGVGWQALARLYVLTG